jgi:hypothetical protein
MRKSTQQSKRDLRRGGGGNGLHHHGYINDASWGKQATDTHYAVTSRYRKATVCCVGDVCVLFLLKRRRSGYHHCVIRYHVLIQYFSQCSAANIT